MSVFISIISINSYIGIGLYIGIGEIVLQKKVKTYNKKQAFTKIASWCARRERTKQEVRNKLYSFGLQKNDKEEIIDGLLEVGLINERRFVKAYVNDKFRLNKWGKIKIENGLKQKGISSELISKGLKQIDTEEYLQRLSDLIAKKKAVLSTAKSSVKNSAEMEKISNQKPLPAFQKTPRQADEIRNKVASFAISRGFEVELVWEKINSLF